jgi:hypothetical protein
MRLTIIIPTYKTPELTLQCLESIFEQDEALEFEVIVVDDCSKDQTKKKIKKRYPKVKFFQNDKNLGFAKTVNKGYRKSAGEYILVLNSDTILRDDFFKEFKSFVEQDLDINAFSGLLLDQDYKLQNHYYMKFPNFYNTLLWHSVILRKTIARLNWFAEKIFSPINRNIWCQEVEQLPGACLFLKREPLQFKGVISDKKIFDEQFDFLFEDVDLSFQMKDAGIKRYLVSSLKVIHLGGESLQKVEKKKFLEKYFQGLKKFCQKNYSKAKQKKVLTAYKIAKQLNFK